MARKRRDNTTAAAIEVGDLIEPNNNGFRATVTRKEDNPSPNIVEPHVAIHWTYPADDFAVNANFRGTSSGRYFRPGDPITRWLNSGRTVASSDQDKKAAGPADPSSDPGDPGHDNHLADTYDAEVETLKQAFEFELCEHCGGDLDVHTFAPDVLGHAQLICPGEQSGDDEPSPDAARCPQILPADTAAAGTNYRQATTRLIAAADVVAEYRADLAAFADTLDGKRWGSAVTGPIKDMDGQLVAIEGDYRDLAGQMKHQGDQGAAAHEQAPWVPDDDSILA